MIDRLEARCVVCKEYFNNDDDALYSILSKHKKETSHNGFLFMNKVVHLGFAGRGI